MTTPLVVAALLLGLLPQDPVELNPSFKKFDKMGIKCKIKTEIKSSTGRNSKYELELDLVAEVDEGTGDKATFSCTINGLKIKGLVNGKDVDYDWSKRRGGRGTAPRRLEQSLKQGWKLKLKGSKGFEIDDGILGFGDVLTIYNPAIFMGMSVPLPYRSVTDGTSWKMEDHRFSYGTGFGYSMEGKLDFTREGMAFITGKMKLTKPEDEVPVEGSINVKGEGFASMEYDLKKGRPKKGATSIKVRIAQGGLKQDVIQIIEFEVRP